MWVHLSGNLYRRTDLSVLTCVFRVGKYPDIEGVPQHQSTRNTTTTVGEHCAQYNDSPSGNC